MRIALFEMPIMRILLAGCHVTSSKLMYIYHGVRSRGSGEVAVPLPTRNVMGHPLYLTCTVINMAARIFMLSI